MFHQPTSRRIGGFTLIELLIVIAIIAVLALIAIPNFLEAQTRSKVARTLNDIRTQATALEAYFIDWNTYTRDSDSSLDAKDCGGDTALNPNNPNWGKCANGALCLTTPVAYMSSLLSDPFSNAVQVQGAGARGYRIASGTWAYSTPPINTVDNQGSDVIFGKMQAKACFAIIGVGPDGNRARIAYKSFPYMPSGDSNAGGDYGGAGPSPALGKGGQPMCWTDYDPTNGTVSVGDIYRFGGDNGNSGHWMRNGKEIGSTPGAACPTCW
ncbi:MAG: type II secretion system protein [Candidatus Sumerlaeota bacterium]|nr:type II secretion system protein [Candidatus Sumerlaeota bacterium]